MKTQPIELWLSLAVSPFLLSYLALRSLNHWLIELGQESEELFRGDRLPLPIFPISCRSTVTNNLFWKKSPRKKILLPSEKKQE